MNSPAPNVAYHLTAAKAKAPELPIDYEPLGPVEPIKRPRSRARARKGPMKRKHGDIDEDKDKDEEEMDGSDMDDDGAPC